MEDYFRTLQDYRRFLEQIPLEEFRERFKPIKWVEQDLYSAILPLESLFKVYWEDRKFIGFDEWFDKFWGELKNNAEKRAELKRFREYYFDGAKEEWFKDGFRARMYRTWSSILTQLDFCYAFNALSDERVEASAEWDRKGIDAVLPNRGIFFQVKKASERKEARQVKLKMKLVDIPYMVLNFAELERKIESDSNRIRNREIYKRQLASFGKYLDILKNGFVVFGKRYIQGLVEAVKKNTADEFIQKVSLELLGKQ